MNKEVVNRRILIKLFHFLINPRGYKEDGRRDAFFLKLAKNSDLINLLFSHQDQFGIELNLEGGTIFEYKDIQGLSEFELSVLELMKKGEKEKMRFSEFKKIEGKWLVSNVDGITKLLEKKAISFLPESIYFKLICEEKAKAVIQNLEGN